MNGLKFNEMKNLLHCEEHEDYLLIPNELINILVKSELKDKQDSGKALAVAYSYVYLNTWMYRYSKYGQIDMDLQTMASYKKLIGLSPTWGGFNYIFKKNGVLDQLGLTETVSYKEAPITNKLVDDCRHKKPEFTYFKDLSEEAKSIITGSTSVKKRQIKKPLLALESRNPMDDYECEGTFYQMGKDMTANIPFDVFVKCMTEESLGHMAFYLYGFIASREGEEGMIQLSQKKIAEYSGLSVSTISKYIKGLREHGLIGGLIQPFVVGRELANYETEANTYWCEREVTHFVSEKKETRRVVSIFSLVSDEDLSEEGLEKKKEYLKSKK